MAHPRVVRYYATDFAAPGKSVGQVLEEIADLARAQGGQVPHYQQVARATGNSDHDTIVAINALRRRRPELTDTLDRFYMGHKRKKPS